MGNNFLVLDLSLHLVSGARALDIQGDDLFSQSLDKNLHSSASSEELALGSNFCQIG